MLDQTSNAPLQSSAPSMPSVKLWTPGFIAGVTFLLGFPAGLVIASINWFRMKMENKAVAHIIGGGVGTVVILIVLTLSSASVGRVIGLGVNLGVLFYLQNLMRRDIETFKAGNHTVENAGQLGGCLIGLGVVVLFLVMAFVIGFVLAILGVPIPE